MAFNADRRELNVATVALTVGVLQLPAGREVRVELIEERGRRVVDLREFAPFTAAGVLMPGRNGLSLPIASLEALANMLAEAVAQAKGTGWLTEQGQ